MENIKNKYKECLRNNINIPILILSMIAVITVLIVSPSIETILVAVGGILILIETILDNTIDDVIKGEIEAKNEDFLFKDDVAIYLLEKFKLNSKILYLVTYIVIIGTIALSYVYFNVVIELFLTILIIGTVILVCYNNKKRPQKAPKRTIEEQALELVQYKISKLKDPKDFDVENVDEVDNEGTNEIIKDEPKELRTRITLSHEEDTYIEYINLIFDDVLSDVKVAKFNQIISEGGLDAVYQWLIDEGIGYRVKITKELKK